MQRSPHEAWVWRSGVLTLLLGSPGSNAGTPLCAGLALAPAAVVLSVPARGDLPRRENTSPASQDHT